ncbi:MAG TPA: methyltransferase [Ktedonobacteraceae bacterium]|nr:methyltransferase [Ktedonobacteraceae bacterium]
MKIPTCLLCETVQLAISDNVLILNSAEDPFVKMAAQQIPAGRLVLAEDNIASLSHYEQSRERNAPGSFQHVPFHEYALHAAPATIDVAAMNILYQPGNAWINYGLQVAMYALKPGGSLYVTGAKDRGILSVAKRLQECFGNVETLTISKGQRVVCSRKTETQTAREAQVVQPLLASFADGDLDEGTRILLEALEVHTTDIALDIGCGVGFIGLHIALLASKGQVTMVDASLAAVDMARHRVEQSGLSNVQVLPSDGIQAVRFQRFDLVVTNPPFHLGGVQTTATAERFIREAAQVLRPRGRFYLVANRFLKYEPTLRACFKTVEEVGGDTRYKVLRGLI